MERMANSGLRFFKRNQQLTPITKTPDNAQPLNTAWKNLFTAMPEKSAQKSVMTFRICAGSNSVPTGYCIHALATRIQRAEIDAPMAVSHVDAR